MLGGAWRARGGDTMHAAKTALGPVSVPQVLCALGAGLWLSEYVQQAGTSDGFPSRLRCRSPLP